ncbi:MAG: hypothetical protein KAW56_04690 [Candidatus Marinimicrobia bacterium]|nr:hypothetical protein [Candidatus Neomarinimicrobiota bacterium]
MKIYLAGKYLLLILLIYSHTFCFALTSKVILTEGSPPEIRQKIEFRLTEIVNSLDIHRIERVGCYLTKEGYLSLVDLIDKTKCRNVNPLYETKLLNLPNGGYEVRDIKVKVNMRNTKGNPYQYIVFTLNNRGFVTDVRFAMENIHYYEIIKEGERLKDFAYRQQILQFIEIFRTAYNRKDIEFLRKVYSKDALIIVGKVIKQEPNSPDLLDGCYLPQDQIKFLKLSKKEYIERLRKIFVYNDFIKVVFEEVTVNKHSKYPEIYGVTLKQYWNSSRYSDEGYLFLMMDFRDKNNPLIHVRSWQPKKFPDGSVVSLGDFEIID